MSSHNKINSSKGNFLCRLLFFGIVILFLFNNLNKNKVILAGDYTEYLLTTVSFANHYTPELKIEDIVATQDMLKNSGVHADIITSIEKHKGFVLNKNIDYMHGYRGYFASLDLRLYAYHFGAYSFVVSLLKPLSDLFFPPLSCFVFTNSILILLVIFYILFISSFNWILKYILSFLFVISPVYYYINWVHPEVYSAVFIFLGLLTLFDKKYIFAILCFVLGSFQNAPIMFLIGLVFANYFIESKVKIKEVLLFCLVSCLVFIPFIFYYYHYRIANLIVHFGFTDYANINISRFCSLFFDLNQGLILGLPLIVILFFPLFIYNIIKIRKLDIKLLLVGISIFAITLPAMLQNNWNMGEAGIIRYGVWIGMPLMFYVVLLIDTYKNKWKYIVMGTLIVLQVAVVYSMGGANIEGWRYVHFNKLSAYVLDNYPQLYNPDPEIFCERVRHSEGIEPTYSPIIYKNENGVMRKMMFHKDYKKSIMKKHQLKENKLIHKRDWIYYNFH